MILPLYRLLTSGLGPLLKLYLHRRIKRGKEDRNRIGERFGRTTIPRPDGRLIWINAASIGEALSVLPLIERLNEIWPLRILLTTGTLTSARLMKDLLPQGVIHQFVPLDHPASVKAFLDHWRPDLTLWTESEIWPNLLTMTRNRGIRMILLQGRLSEASYNNWRKAPSLARALLGMFDLCLAQSHGDGQRLAALGARNAFFAGNLKFASALPPPDSELVENLRSMIGHRPLWLAASTHIGEEQMAGRIHRQLQATHRNLLTIILPRHAERGQAIAQDLQALGLEIARRSHNQPILEKTQIYLADTMGETALFYRLSGIVFIGKSLLSQGGQNPLEPARAGCALIFGPHMENFAEIAAALVENGGAVQVAREKDLQDRLDDLLGKPETVKNIGKRAESFALSQSAVIDDILGHIRPYLDELTDARA